MPLPPLVEPGPALTPEEVRRYSRHLILPDLGASGQRRLKNAKVLVCGAGGLGSPVLLYLAAAGVGTLGIVDFDVVEVSNLHRQVVHRQADIGRSKVRSAADTVAAANPLVRVVGHEQALTSDTTMDVVAGYDVIVDGTDTFATRYLLNDAAVLLAIPYVWASIFRFHGQASVFWPAAPGGGGPCYRCVYPQAPPPGTVTSCAEGGVLGVLCASVGAIQATETIKLIAGIGDPLVGRIMVYDALAMDYRPVRVGRDPSCAVCGELPTITRLVDDDADAAACDAPAGATVSVTTLRTWLAERARGSRDFVLVDVRDPAEREINAIPGAVPVPQAEFVTGTALARLPADVPVVLYCRTGVRSAQVLAVLRAAGRADAVHVAGGVAAWVEHVDPSQPSY